MIEKIKKVHSIDFLADDRACQIVHCIAVHSIENQVRRLEFQQDYFSEINWWAEQGFRGRKPYLQNSDFYQAKFLVEFKKIEVEKKLSKD